MEILIKSDKDITELHIKFAEGSANVDVVKKPENTKKKLFEATTEEVVDNQANVEAKPQRSTSGKKANLSPPIEVPNVENRDPNVAESMSETF